MKIFTHIINILKKLLINRKMQQTENTQEIIEDEIDFNFQTFEYASFYKDYTLLTISTNNTALARYKIKVIKDKQGYEEIAEILYTNPYSGKEEWKDVTSYYNEGLPHLINEFVGKKRAEQFHISKKRNAKQHFFTRSGRVALPNETLKDLLFSKKHDIKINVTFDNVKHVFLIKHFFSTGINHHYKFNEINILYCKFDVDLTLDNITADKITVEDSLSNYYYPICKENRDLTLSGCNIKTFEIKNCKFGRVEISSCKIENLNCNRLCNKFISIKNCDLLKNISFTDSLTHFLHIKNNKNTETISLQSSAIGALGIENNKVSENIELISIKLWGYVNFVGSRFINKDGKSNLYVSNLLLIDEVDNLHDLNNKSVVIINAEQYFKNIELEITKSKQNRPATASFGLTHCVFDTLQTIREAIKQSAPDLNNDLIYIQTRLKKNITDNNLKALHNKAMSNGKNIFEKFKILISQSTTYSLIESKIALWLNIFTGGRVFYINPTVLFLFSIFLFEMLEKITCIKINIVLPFHIFANSSKSVDITLLDIIVNAWLYFLAWQAIKAFTKAKGVR